MANSSLFMVVMISLHIAHSRTVYSNGDITSDSTHTLYQSDSIQSYNALTRLRVLSTGELQIQTRSSTSSSTWNLAGFDTETPGDHVTLQNDGELVVFNTLNEVQWTSNSIAGTAPFRLIVSKDADAYILDSYYKV
eukprot:1097051_1